MARKAKSSVAGLRKLMLAVLAVLLIGVGGLFWFGKAGQRPEKPPAMDTRSAQAEKGMSLIGEDFDYTFTEREKPIFRIRGTSVKADRQGVIYLDNVAVTLYDKQGRVFHVESKSASFNRESNEGQLQGEVFLKGPDELELRTEHLDLEEKGNVVSSPSAVEIRYLGKYVANAGRMQLDLGAETYSLMGGSQVRSIAGIQPPLQLNAQRFVFERTKHWIRCEGGASLHRGEDWLAAQRIYGNVADDESGLTFVHAIWDVNGETRSALQPAAAKGKAADRTKVKFSGKELSVVLQPQGNEPRYVALESPLDGRASLESSSPGLVRTLTARRHIEGTLENGVLNGAQAFGSIEIVENAHLPGKPPTQRQANGQTAHASFRPDGQLATVELNTNVVYRDGDVTATGNRGNLDMDQGRGEFVGAPVVVTSDRGRLEAPRMVYNTDTQIVSARDGVKAKLQKVEETALAGSPLAQGEGPVNVVSQEAFWRQQPSSFVFRGDVRAWRGDNVLLAPEVRGDKAADQLAATGGVKTIWYPTDQEAAQAAGKPAPPAAGATTPAPKPAGAATAAPRQPVQVVATSMTYQQKTGVLIYTGNVRVDQQGKTLSCQKMQVDLDDKRQAKSMVCTGDAKINDPQVGRTVLGQRAVYHVANKQVEVFGDPVTMKDKDGNQIRGKRAVYAMDTGKVEVKGQDPNAPATPAATPAVTPAATPAPAAHPPGSGG